MTNKPYVLITSARNEEAYIEKTIQAVVSQTILPEKWLIVNDGSTDRTAEIVSDYRARYDFIDLLSLPLKSQRNFGAKVNAINAGYQQLRKNEFQFVGNLDADVAFESQYYEKLLKYFEVNPKLGIAGGIILELIRGRFAAQNISLNSVAGAIQLFRRNCYEQIGGYLPLEAGGEDAVMEVLARKNGWQVETFPEMKVFHYRRVAIENKTSLMTKFRQGYRDYLLGYHPLFYTAMCTYRVIDRPYLLGSILRMSGYCWSMLARKRRSVSVEFVSYLKWEQMSRLKSLFAPSRGVRFVKTSRICKG